MTLWKAAAAEAGQKLSDGLCCSETVLRAAVCVCAAQVDLNGLLVN